jgi:hypothetical protein
MNYSLDRLNGILDRIFHILYVDSLGVNHAEPFFVEALDLLRTSEDARAWFLKRAAEDIVHGAQVIMAGQSDRPSNFVDSDLICFVAHATRWQEFATASKERMLSASYAKKLPGSEDFADAIEAALSNDWEDREFYKSFEE